MTKNLGLPQEYKIRPQYFDAFNINEKTDLHNSVIAKLLREQGVRTVLDLTCGTGSQVFHLIKNGFKVVGSDFSPDLLKQARQKAKKAKINVKFIEGDMRTIKVWQQEGKFDGAITIFNAIGHLTKHDFEKALRNIAQNLKTGGVYIFDILNLEAMSDEFIAKDSYHIRAKIGSEQIHAVQCSTINRKTGRLTSYNFDIIQKGAKKPKLSKSKCILQIYTAEELRAMLARNGFEVLGFYGMDGKKFLRKKTTSILVVAGKF